MITLCGANCDECGFKDKCGGCAETNGSPFGGICMTAEYIKVGGIEHFLSFKNQLINEFNALSIEGMPEITDLYQLNGSFVNLEYTLPSGEKVKFLKDNDVYLGNQVECQFADKNKGNRCYGLVAGIDFLLICEYGAEGAEPEIVIFKNGLHKYIYVNQEFSSFINKKPSYILFVNFCQMV
mgnify:CR=1 FL=1|jgi:hypothetical protein